MYPDAAEDGIYILSDNPEYKDAPVGSDAIALLGLRDANFEYEVTSNRVDCFGVLGIAREAAATFRKPFVPPVVKEVGNEEKTEDYISVDSTESGTLFPLCSQSCKKYQTGAITGVDAAQTGSQRNPSYQ